MLSCGHKWIFTYMCAALTKCLETRESAIVHLLPLEKQSKQRRNRGFFKIPKFFEDKELCPVLTLQTYFFKVRSANFELFILLTYVLAGVQYPWRQRLFFRILLQTS